MNRVLPTSGTTSQRISMSVVFGNPSRSCSGSGICQVIPAELAIDATPNCKRVTVDMEWLGQDELCWNISTEEVCTTRLRHWHNTKSLILSQDFTFPLWFIKRTGRAITIAAGQYVISFVDDKRLSITLPYRDAFIGQSTMHLSTQVA